MNKADLIARIAYEADIPTEEATRALKAIINAIQNELASGGDVTLLGFGRFVVAERHCGFAWPRSTGRAKAGALHLVRFRPGKHLKSSINQPKPMAPRISLFSD